MINAVNPSEHPEEIQSETNPATPEAPNAALLVEETEIAWTARLHEFVAHYGSKATALLLAIHGFEGIFENLRFLFVHYPELERQLDEGKLTQNDVNSYARMAIILSISAIISLAFASHLAFFHTKTARIIKICIGLSLYFGSNYLHQFLYQAGADSAINTFTQNIVVWVQSFF